MPVLRPPLLVFHINDNTDDQVLFQAACKQADVPFQWHVAESAERGVSYFNSLLNLSQTQTVRWPDLVVLDLVMPGASGLKVLEFIRATPRLRPLPVVVLTGHPSADLQAAASAKTPKKGDSSAEELKMAAQLKGQVLPIKKNKIAKSKARKITDEEKKFKSHAMLRKVHADTKLWGLSEKKAKEKAEADKNK